MSSNKTAICILTRRFNTYWTDLLKDFSQYDIYIVIDENCFEHPITKIHNKINVVQVDERKCYENNYYKSSTWANLKEIIAWDKALYFFNHECRDYEHIWFLEDDVFFTNEQTFLNVDQQYPQSDLLSAFHEVNERGDIYMGWNHWINVIHRIGTPWARSLICVCRMSRRLLDKIDDYLNDRHLIFIEALFNTLAHQNGYLIDNPREFGNITFDGVWTTNHIYEKELFYHPIKKIDDQTKIREKILSK